MNVLILGSGGRETALAWKISQSNRCNKLFIAPGNAGTSAFGTNILIGELDFDQIASFLIREKIEMIVCGPEAPLAAGLTDYMQENPVTRHIRVIGPGREGARLEWSKDFAKSFMVRHHIPTARYRSFTKTTIAQGEAYLETLNPPFVLKADGLAAGKGVIICPDIESARNELRSMLLHNKFGSASETVVIEEFLTGTELSVFVLTDGAHYVMLPEAKDYKRIFDHDQGPNTGGMGAVSPVPFADKEFMGKVIRQVIEPTINGLLAEKIDYCGFIFFGLMNCDGNPYVIEYNVRLGDPETQVILPRIENDFLAMLIAAKDHELQHMQTALTSKTAVGVVLASKGYPGSCESGKPITLKKTDDDGFIFAAGVKVGADGSWVTGGGRVMTVTALGSSIPEARNQAYSLVNAIYFDGMHYRTDIGLDMQGSK